MRFPPARRGVLLIAGALAAAGACSRETKREPQVTGARVVPTPLVELTAVRDRLWVTTGGGIVVIDPVAETWTMLDLGGPQLVPASVIACGSDVWLRLGDSLAILDPASHKVEARATTGPRLPGGPQEPFRARFSGLALATCGQGDLWIYDNSILFKVHAADAGYERFHVPRLGNNAPRFTAAEFLQGAVYLLTPHAGPDMPNNLGLYRFDPRSSKLDRVMLPGDATPLSVERVEGGLLVKTVEMRSYLLKTDGGEWTPAPEIYSDSLLAAGDSVVWVGASYDVLPASYFVVRYIHDAREPRDLLVLSRFEGPGLVRSPVQFLGMLWLLSNERVLRIDPGAEELVTYQLTDSTGRLVKRSFHLKTPQAALRYLEGDTLIQAPQ